MPRIGIDNVSALLGLGLVSTGVVLALTPAAAFADASQSDVEHVTEEYTSAEISAQYQIDEANSGRAVSESAEFIEDTKNDGIYYESEDLNVLELVSDVNENMDLTVVVPVDYTVTGAAAEILPSPGDNNEDMVAVSAELFGGIEQSDPLSYPDGPGFESWSTVGSGSYTIHARVGKFYSTWFKQRVVDDGDRTYNYMSYKRKGVAEAYPRTAKPDARVHFTQIGAYPSSGETRNHHWVDWSPGIGSYSRSCDSRWTASVSYGAISTSLNWNSCGKYTVAYESGRPGYMLNKWNAGFTHTETTIESGFAYVIALKGATSITINDYQKVTFLDTIDDSYSSCTATNSGKTC